MSTAINHYKIYCNTEAKYVDGWGASTPTVCYNNNTHSVNTNSIQLLEIISTNQVKIKEDSVIIPRNVWIKHVEFSNIESNSSQDRYFTFDIVTSMYSFTLSTDDTNKGDEFTIAVNPDTTLGLITQNITAGDTTLYAPPGLLAYGWNGFELKVTDGTNTDSLGRILSINQTTGVVTFSIPAVHSFSSSNTLVKMTYYTMNSLKFGAPGVLRFGDDVIGGSTAPIGTTVKFTYKNNTQPGDLTDKPKSFILYMTLLF
jgi:hypothetical protein